ncbi:hypothetical protein N7466_004087 [Penicillium verhagenii]|uniref:uncharacterized protein n=1 Tax=Penicillium verhagenii TaxID=1562060 RepID=UPI0025455D4C|nr:uncharacterized protein N7466_004087 [Penicillium verhagenii]KAJ5934540.1 hypothetical protein N7466_004087 [Penicillium verhagenii]
MFNLFLSLILALYYVPICSAHPLEAREVGTTPFNLYAYGTNINGLRVFYADGEAQLGDMSLSSATNKIAISVTYGTKKNTWIARPQTSTGNALFKSGDGSSNSTLLGLSSGTAIANPVTFPLYDEASGSEISPAGDLTAVWSLYGTYVILTETGANFYAKPTGKDGWYILLWSRSVSASVDYIPITLTINAPSAGNT